MHCPPLHSSGSLGGGPGAGAPQGLAGAARWWWQGQEQEAGLVVGQLVQGWTAILLLPPTTAAPSLHCPLLSARTTHPPHCATTAPPPPAFFQIYCKPTMAAAVCIICNVSDIARCLLLHRWRRWHRYTGPDPRLVAVVVPVASRLLPGTTRIDFFGEVVLSRPHSRRMAAAKPWHG